MSVTVTAGGQGGPTRIGRYEIEALIGVGGFAQVYRGRDPALDADVAVKVLDERTTGAEIKERFLREAQLLRRVDNPSVVTVYDIGELDDGRPYFVMEYAAGGVLESRLPHRGEVDPASVRTIITAVGEALTALHGAGVVHRDVKPANLLITGRRRTDDGHTEIRLTLLHDDERVILGDLGIAKDQQREAAGPTIVGGTPRFSAPEQLIRGGTITPATDVYAATGVLWNVLTGSPPPAPEQLAVELASVPAAWRVVIERGLHPDPAQRFGTAAAWADACLDALGDGAGTATVGFRSADPGTICPYKGLAAFQPDDAGLFFGREELVDELVGRLPQSPALVIGGPSGSGKSSLLRAGLIPAIERGAVAGGGRWRIGLLSPGPDPIGELAHRLRQLTGDDLCTPERLRAEPVAVRRILEDGGPALIAIDQFEELFTLNPGEDGDADRDAFVAAMAALTGERHGTIRVAVALRADFYDSCAHFPWLADRINENQVLVGPMTRSELRRAVEGPAHRVGLQLEGGLVETILDDAGVSAGSLPLVAHALMETWLRRRGHVLTVEGYQAAGGVAGAISQRAEQTYERLDDDQQAKARDLILALTAPAETGRDTRRVLRWADLEQRLADRELIETFTEARLLTTDASSVQLAHETLLRTWPRAREWIEESRDDLRTRERLDLMADEWHQGGHEDDLLLRGNRLDFISDWRQRQQLGLAAATDEFVDASESARDHRVAAEAAAARRRRRVRAGAFTALTVLAVAAVIASVVAFVGLGRARDNEELATARFNRSVAATASAQAATDPLLGVALATESVARSPERPGEGLDALVTARTALDEQLRSPLPIADPLPVGDSLAITMTPDASLLAAGGRDGSVSFWDLERRQLIESIADAHGGGVDELAVDPGGSELATVGGTTMVLWDLTARPIVPRLTFELGSKPWSAAFAPDGRLVAVATEDGRAHLYDVATGAPAFDAPVLVAPNRDALTVAFAPDGRGLYVGTGRGELVTVDVGTGATSEPAEVHGSDVWEIVPTPDGTSVFTVSADGSVRRWDAVTGERLADPFTNAGDTALLGLAVVGPAGDELRVGGDDGVIRRWDLRADEPIATSVARHGDRVRDGVGSADGVVYTSLGDDQEVRLWSIDAVGGPSSAVVVSDVEAPLYGVAVNDSRTRVATGLGDGSVVVRRSDGTVESTVMVGDGRVFAVEFVDDDVLLAADGPCDRGAETACSNDDGRVIRWNASTGVVEAEAAALPLLSMALDGQRSRVVGGALGGEVIVWSAEGLGGGVTVGEVGTEVNGVAWTPDGDEILTADLAGRVGFFDPDGGTSRSFFDCCEDALAGIAVDPGGEFFVVADAFEATFVFALDDLSLRQRLTPLVGGGLDVAVTDGGVIAATSLAGNVVLFDAVTGRQLGPLFRLHSGDAWRLDVDSAGHVWSTSEAGTLHRLTALDLAQACTLSEGILDPVRVAELLGGQEPLSCQ